MKTFRIIVVRVTDTRDRDQRRSNSSRTKKLRTLCCIRLNYIFFLRRHKAVNAMIT